MKEELIARILDHLLNAESHSVDLPVIGKYCIVRCRNAGVHAGTVVSADASFVVLSDSRRLWRWKTKFTLSEAAVHGIENDGSRVACVVPVLLIPTVDVAEIIPMSEDAATTIRRATADE